MICFVYTTECKFINHHLEKKDFSTISITDDMEELFPYLSTRSIFESFITTRKLYKTLFELSIYCFLDKPII